MEVSTQLSYWMENKQVTDVIEFELPYGVSGRLCIQNVMENLSVSENCYE